MAAKSPSLQQFRAKVTCSECDSLFEDPVTLSCLHSYCKKCLVKIVEKNAEAPQEPTSVTFDQSTRENLKANACDPNLCDLKELNVDDVKGLKSNQSLKNITNQIKVEDELTSEEGTKCGECVGNPTAAYYCKECRKALCKECKEYHARRQETAKHKPVSLEEIRSESKAESYPGLQGRVTWKCHEHKDQDVDFYCVKHDQLICSHCAITEHKPCDDIKMSSKVFAEKPELETNLKDQVAQTEAVHGKFEQAIRDIEDMRKSLEESKNKARQEIEKRHRQMVEELERQQKTLLDTTDEIYDQKEKNLERQLEEFLRIKAALRNPIDLTEEFLSVGIPEEILYFRAQLQGHLKELFDKYDSYNRDQRDNDIISFKDEGLTLAIGTVVGDPHISEFTIEDPPLQDLHLIKAMEASFKVRCRDIVGNPLDETPHELVVEIQCNGQDDNIIRGVVTVENEEENEGGLYKVTITPQETGEHTLKIYVNIRDTSVHIKDSPFELNVISPPEYERVIESEHLKSPWGIAVSANKKQIVVTDVLQHHLVLFDENYQFVRMIGKEGDGELEFNSPRGVAFNPVNGELVVVEKENNRVQILSAEFEFVKMFGKAGGGEGMFCKPTCVAINKDGYIFITDTTNQQIQYFTPDGNPAGVIGGSIEGYGKAPGKFNDPYAILIDDQDDLIYVTECSGSRVQVFHTADDVAGYTSKFQFGSKKPVGIAYNADNRYIFVSEHEKQVSVFSKTGQLVTSFGSIDNDQDKIQNPMGLAVLGDHRLMVADCSKKRLVIFKY